MIQTTWSQRLRRTIAAGAAVVLGAGLLAGPAAADEETRTLDGGSATWGVKQSFRNYIAMPFVHGSTTVASPATQNDNGTFTFPNATGEVTGDKATIAFAGGVNFAGHDIGEGPVLEIEISNIRVDIDGASGSIVADLASREFIDTTTRGEMRQYDDVRLVDLDLTSAPMTVSEDVVSVDGATSTLTVDGEEAFGGFYEAGAEFDPISFTATLAPVEDPVVWEPAIEVFAADGVTPLVNTEVAWGDTVVVKGTGFDPAGNVGGRGVPIPNTLPQGTYVVFGSFLDEWQPSAGAPSSAREVGSQGWALAESVVDQVPAQYQVAIRAQWVELDETGAFTAELTVAKRVVQGDEVEYAELGNLGVYTYGAGGVNNPDQELYVPVNVKQDVAPEPVPAELTVSPNPVRQGEELTVSGKNLPVGAQVTVVLQPTAAPAVAVRALAATDIVVGIEEVAEDGTIEARWLVPTDLAEGEYRAAVVLDADEVLATDGVTVLPAADEPTETPDPEPTETPTPEPTETPTPEPTPQPSEPVTPQPTQPSGDGGKPGALPSTGGEDAGVFAAGAVLLISGALIAARARARKKV